MVLQILSYIAVVLAIVGIFVAVYKVKLGKVFNVQKCVMCLNPSVELLVCSAKSDTEFEFFTAFFFKKNRRSATVRI